MIITSKQLRQLIREELLREVENPGGGMQVASAKGNINTATTELTKTYEWFKNSVFPAVEDNSWPVIADQDYRIEFADDIRKTNADLNNSSLYIKKGTSFSSANDKKPVHYTNSNASAVSSLTDLYDSLERTVTYYNLNVPMESFPG